MKISVTVNGKLLECDVEPRTLLVHFLREDLGLTGAHIGCDTSQCGACTVHMDGRSLKSCTCLAAQADGHEVTTIEGVTVDGDLHPIQQQIWDKHGLQCGYCTPGMVMSSLSLLKTNPNPTDEEIREGLLGNICRCTGYQGIIAAVRAVAEQASV